MIPKTTTYKQFKEKKAKEGPAALEKGQRKLNGTAPPAEEQNGAHEEEAEATPEAATQSPTVPRTPVVPVSTLIADRTVGSAAQEPEDVEMED